MLIPLTLSVTCSQRPSVLFVIDAEVWLLHCEFDNIRTEIRIHFKLALNLTWVKFEVIMIKTRNKLIFQDLAQCSLVDTY